MTGSPGDAARTCANTVLDLVTRAMCPRFMGCGAVIVRSFARIHETNLKKQGVLALRFVDPDSYSLVKEGDVISIEGLAQFSPGSEFTAVFIHLDGSEDRVGCCHTFSESQVNWFWKGAALNALTSSEDR